MLKTIICVCFLFVTSCYGGTLNQPRWGLTDYPEDVVLVEGTTAVLSATVSGPGAIENSDWKKCSWRRESDGALCKFTYVCSGFLCNIGSGDFHIEKYCDASLSDIVYVGEDPNYHNRQCGIKINNLGIEDNSDWTVELEECKDVGCGTDNGNGNILRHTSRVTIMKEPTELYLSSPTMPSGGQVHAGTVHQVTCHVVGVRPIPSFVWRLAGDVFTGQVLDQTTTTNADQSFDVSMTTEIGILFDMNGKEFSCNAEIYNTTGTHNLIFSKSVGIKLHVQ